MEFIYNIISTWAGAIVTAFEQHLFISAIFTLVAIGAFTYLEKKNKDTLKNLFIVLLGWLIIVPILGTFLDITSWVISFIGKIIDLLVATYKHFESQPIWVLGYLLVSLILYVIWPKLRINNERVFRIGGPILLFLILTFITVPIINMFAEKTVPNNAIELDAQKNVRTSP